MLNNLSRRMPLQKKNQIASLILIGIMLISAALIYGPVIGMKSSKASSFNNQTAALLELTDNDVSSTINGSSYLVLDFYYPGCGPCKLMNNTISKLSNGLQGQISFGRVNVKTNPIIVKKYKILAYPTLLFFNGGVLMNRMKGNTSESVLLSELKDLRSDLDTSKVQLQPGSSENQDPANVIPLTNFGESKPSMPMLINDDNLDSAVSKYPYLVVDAYTPWCEYCHYQNTTLSELSSELQGQVAFGLIDVDKNNATKTRYNITSYPRLFIYKGGKLVNTLIGYRSKPTLVSELKKYDSTLDTSNVKIVPAASSTTTSQTPAKPALTPEQVCANTTKSDKPLLEAFVVSRCPFGLQMLRIMAEIVSKSPDAEKYLKARYIGAVSDNTITSMHGDQEAQENLREICIREEQSDKFWKYVACYMKDGNSSNCLRSTSVDEGKLGSCIDDPSRGLAYAQKDFDLANQSDITGSPTLIMNGKTVSEFDFATNTTNGRSPEALKDLLCCGFNNEPAFCSQELNKTQAMTMFEVNEPAPAAEPQQNPGREINLSMVGEKNPSNAMLMTYSSIDSAKLQYPLLVVEGFANWCGFCKLMNVTMDDLSRELQGQVAFGLIDIERNNETKNNYNITSYPTMLIFKDGKLADKMVGNQQKSSFVAKLKQIEPKLDTSKVKIVQPVQAPSKTKLTPQ